MTTQSAAATSPRMATGMLIGAALIGWLGFWLWQSRHYWEDDAFIHLVYARSVMAGEGFAFQGVPSNGDTSPLWVLLLVLFKAVQADWLMAGKWLASVGVVCTTWVTVLFARRLAQDMGQNPMGSIGWALALSLSSPYFCFWAFSGMEAVAASGLVMLQALILTPRRATALNFFGSATLLGLGPLLRPELVLMLAPGAVFMWQQWRALRPGLSAAQRVQWLLLALTLLALPLALWSTYALWAFGSITPNTNAAKRAMPGEALPLRLVSVSALGYPGVLVGLALWGAVKWRPAARLLNTQTAALVVPRVAWPVLALAALMVAFYLLNHTYVQTRYVAVFAPSLLCVLALTLRASLNRTAFQLAMAACVLAQVGTSFWMALPNVHNKALARARVTAFADDIQRQIPTTEPIAAYAIGQLAFQLPHRIVDIGGITDPEATPMLYGRTEDMAAWARTKGAHHYVWGQAPMPGATGILYYQVPMSGWFPRRAKYSEDEPSVLWQLPNAQSTARQ